MGAHLKGPFGTASLGVVGRVSGRPVAAWCDTCHNYLPSHYGDTVAGLRGLARHAEAEHGAELCPTCKGDGAYPDGNYAGPCPTCMGSGTTTAATMFT